MRDLALAIREAARASTLEELGQRALPALARALHASPTFFAQIGEALPSVLSIAGDPGVLATYTSDYLPHDPIGRASVTSPGPVAIAAQRVSRRTIQGSRAYQEFHRAHDFEHHISLRVAGRSITSPGALVIGMTRGRRMRPFDGDDADRASLALAAFTGAVERIALCHQVPERDTCARVAGLSRAERRVLAALALGLSNAAIARKLFVSVDTVKTHLHRIYRKLDVSSRTETLAVLGLTGTNQPFG